LPKFRRAGSPRKLANGAKMIESNPSLMQLRVLQAVGVSTGNTLILGLPAQSTAIPIKPGPIPTREIPDQTKPEPE